MDERYRAELDQIRLTEESKAELARVLARRQEAAPGRTRRPWKRTALVLAAAVAVLTITAGGIVLTNPVLQSYFADNDGYRQNVVELGQSSTKHGWTVTLTDCVADDYTIYLGVTLTAPEGTVLDAERGYHFDKRGAPAFPGLGLGGSGHYEQVEDDDPSDNQVSFVFQGQYLPDEQSLNGKTMEFTLGGLYHFTQWNESRQRWDREYDCRATWRFRTTLNYPDNIIHLYPNLPVHTLDVDATITEVVVSPLTVFVCIEGDSLKGHHSWVPKNAPDGYYGCVEYQEVNLYTTDGTVIPMSQAGGGSGCSGGSLPDEAGWLHLVRRPEEKIIDVEQLDHLTVCGVEIPLR